MERDVSLDLLLDLDGQTFVLDDDARFWVRFVVKRVPASAERPHGLAYSLTLHGRNGDRLVGFDNAHPVQIASGPGRRARVEHDHHHRLQSIRSYAYKDAATLLSDFWAEVDALLTREGLNR